jgi:hypothetical protein
MSSTMTSRRFGRTEAVVGARAVAGAGSAAFAKTLESGTAARMAANDLTMRM